MKNNQQAYKIKTTISNMEMETHTIYPSNNPVNNYRLTKVLPVRGLIWDGAFAGIYLSYEIGSGEKFKVRGANFGDFDFSDAESALVQQMVSRHKELAEKGDKKSRQEQQTFNELSGLLQAA